MISEATIDDQGQANKEYFAPVLWQWTNEQIMSHWTWVEKMGKVKIKDSEKSRSTAPLPIQDAEKTTRGF